MNSINNIPLEKLIPYLGSEIYIQWARNPEYEPQYTLFTIYDFHFLAGMRYFKPVLKPLSTLKQEMTKDGRTFIPIYEFAPHIVGQLSQYMIEGPIRLVDKKRLDDTGMVALPYFVIQKLISWGFDVFFLIDQEQAVPFCNLKKQDILI